MSNYKDEQWEKNTCRLHEIISELPVFCIDYFVYLSNRNTSILTQLNYAYDLRLFFDYVFEHVSFFQNIKRTDFKPENLNDIKLTDINSFLNYISLYYNKNDKKNSNHEHGKARKIATLRSFFKYFYKNEFIHENICDRLETPKINEKDIIRLESNEIADLLDAIENQTFLTERQKILNKKNRLRDLAIFTLFLSTGIRVSELVSIDISDIQFDINAFTVIRKGGNQVKLYFGNEAKAALLNYLDERKSNGSYSVNSPLFLSSVGSMRRLTVRSVENLVKKYTAGAIPFKQISPHKLRSTFGTRLYHETGDIYLVADVLDHKDINTTRKHYAAQKDDSKQFASKQIKLRN